MRVLLYLSLCQDHRCLFMDAVKFADIIFELNLTDFHWLYQPQPVRARIQYKIALGLLTFKIYTSTHPTIRPIRYFNFERHHVISAPATMSILHVVHDAGARTVFRQSGVLPRHSNNLKLITQYRVYEE